MKYFALIIATFISLNLSSQKDSIRDAFFNSPAFEVFLDSVVDEYMNEFHVPGAVVTIVKDTHNIYYKGYGYADLENGIEVDPEKTGFRIASITKTFTATAALQLVEQGKVDLHTPISEYLPDEDFELLKWKPMTLHQLLTHTAGIDYTDISDAALTPEKVVPLEQLARYHIPDQVHTPGEAYSYSNFGYAFTGYLIQAVSGIPYPQYIQENILDPLGMVNSSIYQPSREPIKSQLARSYEWDGIQKYLVRDYTNTLPGGGMISTAKDMAAYMSMHLGGGQYNDQTILSGEYHRELISQQYGANTTPYGVCYSFFQGSWNGFKNIQHTGAQLGFLSLMVLFPDSGTGVFITHNSRKDANGFRYDVADAILDTLIGTIEHTYEIIPKKTSFDIPMSNFEGVYKQMSGPRASFEKMAMIIGMFNNDFDVVNDGDSLLLIEKVPFARIDETLFQVNDPDRNNIVEFRLDENNTGRQMVYNLNSYEKIPFYKRKRLMQIFAMISFLTLLIHFLSRPVKWIVRKIRKKEKIKNRAPILNGWMYWTGSLFVIAFIGILIIFSIYQDQLSDYGIPLPLKSMFFLNVVAGILTLFFPLALYRAWQYERFNVGQKLLKTLIILSIVFIAGLFWNYNLIGFHY